MSDARAALAARFQGTLRTRLQRISEWLSASRRVELLIELHTLKGEARMLGLLKLATLAHELEGSIAEHAVGVDHSRALEEMRLELEHPLEPAALPDPDGGEDRASTMLAEWARHAEALAAELGKQLRVAARADAGVAATVERLWPALLHLLRNAVDHGLELPHERGDKPREGQLVLSAEVRGPAILLTLEDDGRGIDPDEIRAAALTRGVHDIAKRSEAELLELLFEPGFSTRGEITTLSGRGVGLGAARQQVEALGGRITLETELGRGTRFVIWVPRTPNAG